MKAAELRMVARHRVKELGGASGRMLSINEDFKRGDETTLTIRVVELISVGGRYHEQMIHIDKYWKDEYDSEEEFIHYAYTHFNLEFDWYGWYDRLKAIHEK